MSIVKELASGYEYVVNLWKHCPGPVSITGAVLQLAKAMEVQREVGGAGKEWVWS